MKALEKWLLTTYYDASRCPFHVQKSTPGGRRGGHKEEVGKTSAVRFL